MRGWTITILLAALLASTLPVQATHFVLQDDAGSGADAPRDQAAAFAIEPGTVYDGLVMETDNREIAADPGDPDLGDWADLVDVYAVPVREGDTVELAMAAWGGGVGAYLVLPGESTTDSPSRTSSLGGTGTTQRTAPADGVMFAAFHISTGGASEYQFSVGINEPAPEVDSRPFQAMDAGRDVTFGLITHVIEVFVDAVGKIAG